MTNKLEAVFGTASPVALVTGSGSPRLGNAVVRSLAERGYRIAIHAYRSTQSAEQTATELRSQGTDAFVASGDIRCEHQVRELVRRANEHFGRIDVLVNCAAVWTPQRLEDVSAEEVRHNFDVNTLGTFLCCQQVGLLMVKQTQGGAIVNVGDWATARPYLDYPAYFPSKGAIPTMTRDFAVELASRNPRVRVSAILPGPAMIPDGLPKADQEAAIDLNLLKRAGSPQYVADAVVFLAEHEFITGVCLPVDGGRSIYSPTQ
ncbi:MAG: SDR family oxidoreductase [Planctomycetaceae bacterium]|nr:SDR family oxidoreductase [Planctomycetales bacterium]MCB9923423.1 SDR family oxidoreductase [Planctomycetaceae bacterium]